MEVKCPKCSSRFNLPDNLAKDGVSLRCSICRHVFVLELSGKKDQKTQKLTTPDLKDNSKLVLPEKKKSRKKFILLSVVLFLLCLGGALAWQFFFNGESEEPKLNDQELARKVKLLTMRNVRQYIVDNEKVGKVFVIEGKVVNEFPEPKELIAVEGAIYGSDKRVIATKKQRCGTQLSLFQLQVLSEKEMEAFLNNKIEILTNNINLKQGAEVPFMVLFYSPPDNVAEFGVRIVDVRDTPVNPEQAQQH
ncbi:MAG: zinc-ribbon domain-containing protein [Desulfovibrio sp.]|nr:zinc-ribbon domain-containing protein [Desulfovibrio sp.]